MIEVSAEAIERVERILAGVPKGDCRFSYFFNSN